ncbi:proteinase inhibitor I4 serpin [Halobiforma lacisalsi AJ5]|uniref:Proteinase inhibitor I4 serpin n=1 Tax=Natronobacterium lacisalsi AJ5 TaxID=358396 RepID=M0LEG3_NATLA|nr:serpin family protein [Halobiforma lacisalsi]APW96746.1 proteinase inhibitor I4 serpin [Halobiforma lacisalsi AJ5]EMA31967.1 proteinase inhibitor I4 serpin [Halobiforma lacisalsi AJ5]
MSTDIPARRRTFLALTGAVLSAAAGCTSDDSARDGGDETESGTDPENGGFDGYEPPEFPQLEPVTDPESEYDLEMDALAEQVRGNVAFSLAALDELRSEEPEANLFFSPYSISVALAMTYASARDETAAEMAETLRYELAGSGDDDRADLHAAFGALEDEFERRNDDGAEVETPEWAEEDEDDENDGDLGFQLSSANAVWADEGYPFDEAYFDLLETYYGAGEHVVDFAGDPEGAREEINAWVEDRTNDRIEDLLPEDAVTTATRLVLTNAVYFLAAWKHDFDPDATEPGPFTGIDGTETEVELMSQSAELRYAEIDGHQLVELPYANGDTSMVVVLPAEGEFESFERSFTVDRLATLLEETSRSEVDLTMPKFGIESKFSLVETLERLGMKRAFTSEANFGGMVEGDGGLAIDDILHQSFVDVDEEGTEAAAATAVLMAESGPPVQAEMTVDRPFLFYVRDRPTETPLFVGRVVDGETLQEG